MELACDASANGLGAVVSHQTAEGVEEHVTFSSRKMTATEELLSTTMRGVGSDFQCQDYQCIGGEGKSH